MAFPLRLAVALLLACGACGSRPTSLFAADADLDDLGIAAQHLETNAGAATDVQQRGAAALPSVGHFAGNALFGLECFAAALGSWWLLRCLFCRSSSTGSFCVRLSMGLAVFVAWFVFRMFTAECTIDKFDVNLILPENALAAGDSEKFDRGTSENMHIDGLDLDLMGTWWMDYGNESSAQQLVSFAGSHGELPYPTSVLAPFSKARRWTYSNDFLGRFWISSQALTGPPDAEYNFRFTNSSYAGIAPSAFGIEFTQIVFGFDNINADEWDRVDSYTLRRIVNADGTAGPFWDAFVEYYTGQYPDGQILTQASDSGCKRKCQYFLPCFACNMIC